MDNHKDPEAVLSPFTLSDFEKPEEPINVSDATFDAMLNETGMGAALVVLFEKPPASGVPVHRFKITGANVPHSAILPLLQMLTLALTGHLPGELKLDTIPPEEPTKPSE